MTAPRDWRELSHGELYGGGAPGAGASVVAEAIGRHALNLRAIDAAPFGPV